VCTPERLAFVDGVPARSPTPRPQAQDGAEKNGERRYLVSQRSFYPGEIIRIDAGLKVRDPVY